MPEGLFITKTDWDALVKKIDFLEQYIINSLKERGKSKWMTPQEAMEEIGCKATTLNKLRPNGSIDWKTTGKGRGIMILRKSVEDFNNQHSTIYSINRKWERS